MEAEDYGARVAAARAYCRLNEEAAAEVMGFSKRTLARVEDNDRELTIPEAKRLARAADVPIGFLTDGWEVQITELRDALARLHEQVAAMQLQAEARAMEVLEQLGALRPPAPDSQPSRRPEAPDGHAPSDALDIPA